MKEQHEAIAMIEKGRKLAPFLGTGWRVLGVDPGYLFVREPHGSLDLPEDVVDSLLKHIREKA